MKTFTLFLLTLFSAAASAGKITYHKGKNDFNLEYDGKILSYGSPTLKHVFIIDSCNRQMLEKFWKKTLKNAEEFPHATSLPDSKKGYVQVDNEYRLILPMVKNRLSTTEHEMINLRMREKYKCKRQP